MAAPVSPAPMTMDYFVWALADGRRTVVVDLGFGHVLGPGRRDGILHGPARGVAGLPALDRGGRRLRLRPVAEGIVEL